MKRSALIVIASLLSIALFIPCSCAGGDWGAGIEGLDEFLDKYRKAKGQYELKAAAVSSLAMKIAAVEDKYPLESRAASLTIGEFESTKEFRARVERQKELDEQNGALALQRRKEESAGLEKEKERLLAEALGCQKELSDLAFEFTNEIRAVCAELCAEGLPYFDRDSMSFRNLPSPFFSPEWVSSSEVSNRTKFIVNAEVEDFDTNPMPRNFSKYEGDETYGDGDDYTFGCRQDSFAYWLEQKRRKVNVNVDEVVSLKFKSLSDAGEFKNGLSNGTIKAWLCCSFKVGLPSDWIIEQGHYERSVIKSPIIGVLNAIKFGVDDDTLRTGKQIWRPAVIGRLVPVRTQAFGLALRGEPVKSMDIEVVAASGKWTVKKLED